MIIMIFAVTILAAYLVEHFILRSRTSSYSTVKKLCVTAMCAALASVLMLVEIPLFFAPSFYKLDFSELPVLICAFALGPFSGVVCEFLKILLHLMMKGTTTAFVGELSNFLIGICLIFPASTIYAFKKTKKRAVWGLVVGALAMTTVGSLLNAFVLIPQYIKLFSLSEEAILAMASAVNPSITSIGTLILFAVIPFNLLKALLVSAITMLVYKHVRKVLK